MILMLTHLWYADSNRPLEQNCVLLIKNKCLQEKKNEKEDMSCQRKPKAEHKLGK